MTRTRPSRRSTAFQSYCKELACHFLNTWPCLPFGGRELLKIDISLMLKELGRDCGSCVPVTSSNQLVPILTPSIYCLEGLIWNMGFYLFHVISVSPSCRASHNNCCAGVSSGVLALSWPRSSKAMRRTGGLSEGGATTATANLEMCCLRAD